MTKKRYTIDVGEPVSIVDHGGEGPLIVCVHGLEGSALNWDLIAPKLTKTYRVIAPDLSGFGYTPPHAGGTSVGYNADVVRDVIDHFGGEAAVIGNSMGALVSLYFASGEDIGHQAGELVNQILGGQANAPIPYTSAREVNLVVNLKTAKRIGIEIPRSMTVAASEVIQ